MLTVAYYTEGTPYAVEANRLRTSLDRVGMPYEIRTIPAGDDNPPGSRWYRATYEKPFVIRNAMKEHKRGILYVDVDAVVHDNCEAYFDALDCDMAAHWFQGPAGGYAARNDDRMLSGTLYFAFTPDALSLLNAWCQLNGMLRRFGCQQGGGQKNLWYLTTCLKSLRIHRLPGRYCYVFDKSQFYPEGEPRIVEHFIASRENRDKPHTAAVKKMCRTSEIETQWQQSPLASCAT